MLLSTPRYFGFPSQSYVRTQVGLTNLINAVNGNAPCFVSVLQYPQPKQPVFNKFLFDLDSNDLSIALKDVNSLRAFATKHQITYTVIFSGRKGFHFYFHCKPSTITSYLLGAIHSYIADECKLQTADKHLFGDLRRVIRVPTSRHVTRDGVIGKYYCRYISDADIDKGLKHILQICTSPGENPVTPKAEDTLSDITERFPNFDMHAKTQEEKQRLHFESAATSDAITELNVVVPECLRQHIDDYNPVHVVRYETTCWLKLIKFSNVAIYDFYEHFAWRDWNRQRTRYQVRRAKARPVWCWKLREILGDTYCKDCSLGEKCVIHR